MLSLQCHHCGQQLDIDEKYARQAGTCKKCGNSIRVPAGPGAYIPTSILGGLDKGKAVVVAVIILACVIAVWAVMKIIE